MVIPKCLAYVLIITCHSNSQARRHSFSCLLTASYMLTQLISKCTSPLGLLFLLQTILPITIFWFSGETFMETQTRILKEKELKIRNALEKLKRKRSLLRTQRKKREFPIISVMGYTNCGKQMLIGNCNTKVLTLSHFQLEILTTISFHCQQAQYFNQFLNCVMNICQLGCSQESKLVRV